MGRGSVGSGPGGLAGVGWNGDGNGWLGPGRPARGDGKGSGGPEPGEPD